VGRRRIVSRRGDVRSNSGCPSFAPAGLRTNTTVNERTCARPVRLGDDRGVYRARYCRFWGPGGSRTVGSLAKLKVLDGCRSSILSGSRSVSVGRYLGDSYRSHRNCLCAVGPGYVSVSIKRRSRLSRSAASGLMAVSGGRGSKRRSRSFRFANGHRSAACRRVLTGVASDSGFEAGAAMKWWFSRRTTFAWTSLHEDDDKSFLTRDNQFFANSPRRFLKRTTRTGTSC
jgi:hypothetical protein